MTDRILTLDVGGTKIAAALVDPDGTIVHRRQRPTPRGDAEAVWATVESLLADVQAEADGTVTAVGISSAGPVDLPGGHRQPGQHRRVAAFPDRGRALRT